MRQPIRVALVDDDKALCAELATRFEVQGPAFQLIASFQTAESAIVELPKLRPHVVLMDIGLPKTASGVDCVRTLSPLLPETRFMMFTALADAALIFESLKAGASGYLVKREIPEKLFLSISSLLDGCLPMSTSVARKVLDYFMNMGANTAVLDVLTPREEAVLRSMSHGSRNKEIAAQLGIELATVETHIRNIFQKLQVTSRKEAIRKFRSPTY